MLGKQKQIVAKEIPYPQWQLLVVANSIHLRSRYAGSYMYQFLFTSKPTFKITHQFITSLSSLAAFGSCQAVYAAPQLPACQAAADRGDFHSPQLQGGLTRPPTKGISADNSRLHIFMGTACSCRPHGVSACQQHWVSLRKASSVFEACLPGTCPRPHTLNNKHPLIVPQSSVSDTACPLQCLLPCSFTG